MLAAFDAEQCFAPACQLRAQAQPRELFPWLGSGPATAPDTGGGGGGGGLSATVDLNTMHLPAVGALGDYIWLTPTKLGGGAQVQDLASGKTMAWIEYWNYVGSEYRSKAHPRATPVLTTSQRPSPRNSSCWFGWPRCQPASSNDARSQGSRFTRCVARRTVRACATASS